MRVRYLPLLLPLLLSGVACGSGDAKRADAAPAKSPSTVSGFKTALGAAKSATAKTTFARLTTTVSLPGAVLGHEGGLQLRIDGPVNVDTGEGTLDASLTGPAAVGLPRIDMAKVSDGVLYLRLAGSDPVRFVELSPKTLPQMMCTKLHPGPEALGFFVDVMTGRLSTFLELLDPRYVDVRSVDVEKPKDKTVGTLYHGHVALGVRRGIAAETGPARTLLKAFLREDVMMGMNDPVRNFDVWLDGHSRVRAYELTFKLEAPGQEERPASLHIALSEFGGVSKTSAAPLPTPEQILALPASCGSNAAADSQGM